MSAFNREISSGSSAPQWLTTLRSERATRKRVEADAMAHELGMGASREARKEKLIKMVVRDDYYVPRPGPRPDHNTDGSNAMLYCILQELGPEFFSDSMKKDPAEKAREDQEKFEKLRDAVYWGEVEKLPRLIRNGASMYRVEDATTKKTLIHLAAARNRENIILELKNNKLPSPILAVDSNNCNALHDAAVKGHIGPLRALVQLKADLDNRDSLEKKTCLHKAAEGGFVETVKELILLKVARLGFSDVIRALVEMGADPEAPDKDGGTPLHLAANRGKEDTIQLLVELGCKDALKLLVTQLGANVNARDMYQETPLHRAATLGKDETVRLLVQLNANINAMDKYQETPLHRAAAMGKEATIRTLVELRAVPDSKDMDSRTPLHAAAAKWQRHAIVELTDVGCSLLDYDKFGETPLHRAAAMDEKEAMHALVEMGAPVDARNLKGETALERQARRAVEHRNMYEEALDLPLAMGTDL